MVRLLNGALRPREIDRLDFPRLQRPRFFQHEVIMVVLVAGVVEEDEFHKP
jgi:hypothetical protein